MALRGVVWAVGAGPLLWMGGRLLWGGLGANPIEAALHLTGRWALVLLLLGLSVTPLRRLTRWDPLIRARRPLGLFAFSYAALHLLVYLSLHQGFAWSFIVEDLVERPFITTGMAAFLLLVPLALTSTRAWIRRLGKRWRTLHRLVYPAGALAVLHFYRGVKADTFWPLVAAGALAALLVARVLPHHGSWRVVSPGRRRGRRKWAPDTRGEPLTLPRPASNRIPQPGEGPRAEGERRHARC